MQRPANTSDRALRQYKAKRNFPGTPERVDGGDAGASALSFVIQKHWARRLHYDFRKLQAAGLVRYSRGKITVLDRPNLEKRACECYAVVKHEYDRLISPDANPASITSPTISIPPLPACAHLADLRQR